MIDSDRYEAVLKRSERVLGEYAAGMRKITDAIRATAEPIGERLRALPPDSPARKADLETIEALAKVLAAVEQVLENVGKAWHE